MENKEKEIHAHNTSKKKVETLKTEYTSMQNILLNELFMKMVKNITPIEFKAFTNKFIKLKEFTSSDTYDILMDKINENQEMYINKNKIFVLLA